jgi:nitrogen-specific signal transduction histidine kinase
MKILDWERIQQWRGLLATGQREPLQQAERIVGVLRDVALPAKAGLSLVVLYYLYSSGWKDDPIVKLALSTLKEFCLIYLLCNFVGAIMLVFWRRLPPELAQWLAFTLGLLDGLFMAGLTSVTGGMASPAFWVFPGLIVLNAFTIPLATPQIVLNLLLGVFYMGAVVLTPLIGWNEPVPEMEIIANMYPQALQTGRPATTNAASSGLAVKLPPSAEHHGTNQAEALARIIRNARKFHAAEEVADEEVTPARLMSNVSVLWLLAVCCYGAQVLSERQRQAIQQAAEFAAREGQLHSAGRLAAEFAHQIKNPLAIINNAAYSLQRSVREQKSAAAQVEIIQEEVARADKVITQIMGYAQLSEGRVERLNVAEEIRRAAELVFPGGAPAGIKLKKRLAGPFPPLLMQRGHLADILVNLLLNAREALADRGNVAISAVCNPDQTVEIAVTDDGPGIPPDKLERVFEAYFTTKEKGSGLGLAIVRHNVELYGGTVRVQSVLGKGATFTISLPVKLQSQPLSK